jgi:SAM-dependent methyltransferase
MSTWHPLSSLEFIHRFPLYKVSSAGTPDAVAELTISAILQTLPFLERLSLDLGHRQVLAIPADRFGTDAASLQAAAKLKELFDFHGSDKANVHNYHHVYGAILKNPAAVTAVFEIGLGTNNTDVVSNMGMQGRPGSSLRAFRDFLPNAQIFGADVDRRILFQEDRIQTHFIDQTDLGTVDALRVSMGRQFDLIIDDGLHSPNANVASLVFGLSLLKPDGVFVVEDIAPPHLPVWQVISTMLRPRFQMELVAGHAAYMCLIRRSHGFAKS